MAEKKNLTRQFVLRIDARTLAAVEKWAEDEFRSTNGQFQWMIQEMLRKSGRLKSGEPTDTESEENNNN